MFEDELPKNNAVQSFPALLDNMSVSDLAEYIEDLQAEIDRVKQEIATKNDASSAADSFFN